jgi:hypothetical protein
MGGFSWRGTFSGGVIGVAIGVVAHLLDASPWWWLAVPLCVLLGASLRLQVSMQWTRK